MSVQLAQRLDELAIANRDGLLSDDEYRLLRQNVFERFTSDKQAALPREAHVVPIISLQVPQPKQGVPEPRPDSRASSPHRIQFAPLSPRPHSIMSVRSDMPRSSSASVSGKSIDEGGVAGLIRRATLRGRTKEQKAAKQESTRSSRLVAGLSRLLSPRKERSSPRSKSADSGARFAPANMVIQAGPSPKKPDKRLSQKSTAVSQKSTSLSQRSNSEGLSTEPSSPVSTTFSPVSTTYSSSPVKARPSIFSASTYSSSKASIFSSASPSKPSARNSATPSIDRNSATPSKNSATPSRNSATPSRNSATPSRNSATPTTTRTAITPELLASILSDETTLADATPADIRRAIEGVEDERRVVLDAFEGLEMSVLARVHCGSDPGRRRPDEGESRRRCAEDPSRLSAAPGPYRPRSNSSVTHGSSRLRADAGRARAESFRETLRPMGPRPRSGSRAGSELVKQRTRTESATQAFLRKDSFTSVASGGECTPPTMHQDTMHRDNAQRLSDASGSSDARITKVHDGRMDEVEDVRRRRGEVVARYEARLEYLRALMRGAEIRERARR